MNNSIRKDLSVLFILEDGRLAGPHIYILRLCKTLNIKTKILLPFRSSVFVDLLTRSNVKYKRVYISSLGKSYFKLFVYFIGFIPEIILLTFYFIASSERIVYVAGGAWQVKGIIAGKLARKKVVWHLNDTEMPATIRSLFNLISFLADGFVFASEATEHYYADLLPERPSSVIPSPVDEDILLSSEMVNRKDWEGKKVIGMVANVNPIKNIEDFLYVAEELNSLSLKELHFVVVGPIFKSQQKYYEKLKQIIEKGSINNIEFVGQTDSVGSYLKRFDIFLFTSRSESSPLAVWEAMMVGLPIISYKVGDIDRFIENKTSGLLVQTKDKENLVKQTLYLLDNYKYAQNLGKEANRVAKEKLSAENCSRRHLDYFNLLL